MRRNVLRVAVAVVLLVFASTGVAASAPEKYDRYHAWIDPGPVDYPLYNTQWVPQGLTNFGTDRLVISYYDSKGDYNSRIVITDRAGNRLKTLRFDHKGHVGGLAATGSYLWVASGGKVYRYSRSAIANASSGSVIEAGYTRDVAGKASYAYAEGESIWVGDFNWDYDGGIKTCPELNDYGSMYRYTIDSDNTLSDSYVGKRTSPAGAQGVVVTSNRIIWSTSCGRDNDSTLVVWDKSRGYNGTNDYGNVYTAPNMSEGMTRIGSTIFLVFEAGSTAYSDADYRVRSIHRGAIPEAYGDGWPG